MIDQYQGIGRVGSLKMAYMPDGTPVMEMSVAIDRSYKNKNGQKVDDVYWLRVKAFGKQAEFLERWCRKGNRVAVIARPKERSWEDQTGQKRYATEYHINAPGMGVTPIDWPDGDNQPQQPPQRGQGGRGGRQASGQDPRACSPVHDEDDLGPAFPSEATGVGMDDIPF